MSSSVESALATDPSRSFMRIAIGADHAGFAAKEHLIGRSRLGHEVDDRGTTANAGRLSADLRRRRPPVAAARPTAASSSAAADRASRSRPTRSHGIRAALCNDLYTARLSREHNDANVLDHGRPHRRLRARRRDRDALADDALRGRTPPAPHRSDSALEQNRTRYLDGRLDDRDSFALAHARRRPIPRSPRPSRTSAIARTAASS